MAIHIDIGSGQKATIEEPQRYMFAGNLGGAIEYSFAHFIYKVLDIMGGGIGSFLGGIAVQFMERVEPHLVEYAKPLLDVLLEAPDLDPHLREFLSKLKNPDHEAAAAILGGLASSAGGSVINNALGVLTWPVTAWLNHRINPARPSPADAWAMFYRGLINANTRVDWLNDQGWFPTAQNAYGELARPRPDVGTMAGAVVQGKMTQDSYLAETRKRGILDSDALLFVQMSKRYLAVGDIVNAYLRNEVSAVKAKADLQAQGFTAEDAQTILNLGQQIPQIPDLIRMSVREAFSEDVVRQFGYDADFPADVVPYAEKHGLSADWVRRYWRAHWELPSVQLGYEMFHRGVIDRGTLETLLRTADYPPFWRDKLIAVAYHPFTRVDARRMYGTGVLTRDQVKQAYRDLGYDDAKAEALAEFTVRYEDENGLSKKQQYKDLSQSTILNAFKKGVLSRVEAFDHLKGLQYEPEDAELLLNLAEAEKAVTRVPDWEPEYLRDMISIVEQSFIKALIGTEAAKAMLKSLGLGDAEIQYRLDSLQHAKASKDLDATLNMIGDAYVNRSITHLEAVNLLGLQGIPASMQNELFSTWDRQRDIRSRKLTEAQYTDLWEMGVIDDAEYLDNLRGLGLAEKDVNLLYTLRKFQAEGGTTAAPKQKLLTVKQYTDALKAGVITKEQFVQQLSQLGYELADINVLLYFALNSE